jgi:hypothetical protein
MITRSTAEVFPASRKNYRNLQSNILLIAIGVKGKIASVFNQMRAPQKKPPYTSRMTWQLVLQSFGLLRDDLKLIVFPILSAIGAVALSLPYLLMLFNGRLRGDIHWADTWLLVFAWYACASFVTIFFNCALAACVQMRFAGQTPTIAGGLKRAASRVHTILLWSILTSTVGRLLKMLEQRVGFITRIATALVGLSWNMATVLIVPVLVMEDRGVIDSVRRSAALLRQTWGEQVISGIWFGWMGLVIAIPGVVLGALGANGYPIFIVPTVLWFAGWLAAFTAAREIFTVVLYRYATTGEPPAGFDAGSLSATPRR